MVMFQMGVYIITQSNLLLYLGSGCRPRCRAASLASLLRVAAQDLQAQGDVVVPTPRVDAEVAGKQRRIKHCQGLLVRVAVPKEDLRKEGCGEGTHGEDEGGELRIAHVEEERRGGERNARGGGQEEINVRSRKFLI